MKPKKDLLNKKRKKVWVANSYGGREEYLDSVASLKPTSALEITILKIGIIIFGIVFLYFLYRLIIVS